MQKHRYDNKFFCIATTAAAAELPFLCNTRFRSKSYSATVAIRVVGCRIWPAMALLSMTAIPFNSYATRTRTHHLVGSIKTEKSAGPKKEIRVPHN